MKLLKYSQLAVVVVVIVVVAVVAVMVVVDVVKADVEAAMTQRRKVL